MQKHTNFWNYREKSPVKGYFTPLNLRLLINRGEIIHCLLQLYGKTDNLCEVLGARPVLC